MGVFLNFQCTLLHAQARYLSGSVTKLSFEWKGIRSVFLLESTRLVSALHQISWKIGPFRLQNPQQPHCPNHSGVLVKNATFSKFCFWYASQNKCPYSFFFHVSHGGLFQILVVMRRSPQNNSSVSSAMRFCLLRTHLWCVHSLGQSATSSKVCQRLHMRSGTQTLFHSDLPALVKTQPTNGTGLQFCCRCVSHNKWEILPLAFLKQARKASSVKSTKTLTCFENTYWNIKEINLSFNWFIKCLSRFSTKSRTAVCDA